MSFGSISAFPQCTNKISVDSNVNPTKTTGVILVDIKSDTNYTCTLLVETASGDVLVSKKKARGNKKLEFKDLNLDKLYSIKVVFSNEKDFLCSSLSKKIILK